MIHSRIRVASGEILRDPPAEALHAVLEDDRSLAWLDLESPTADELGLIAGLLSWEHLTVEDLTRQGQRAKLEASVHWPRAGPGAEIRNGGKIGSGVARLCVVDRKNCAWFVRAAWFPQTTRCPRFGLCAGQQQRRSPRPIPC